MGDSNANRHDGKCFEFFIFAGSAGGFVWSLWQWIVIIYFSDAFNDYDYISYAAVLITTIAIGIFLLVPNIRQLSPWNTIILLIIIQGMSMSMATVMVKATLNFLFVCISISVVLVTVVTLAGLSLRNEILLKDEIVLLVLIIFIINTFLLFAISYTVEFKLCVYTFCAIFLSLSLASLLLHAQALRANSRRTIPDLFYGIFAFYMHFVVFCVLLFYVAALMWPKLVNVDYFLNLSDIKAPELDQTDVLNDEN